MAFKVCVQDVGVGIRYEPIVDVVVVLDLVVKASFESLLRA